MRRRRGRRKKRKKRKRRRSLIYKHQIDGEYERSCILKGPEIRPRRQEERRRGLGGEWGV